MRSRRRGWPTAVWAVLTALVAVAATGCAGGDATATAHGKVTLTFAWWGNDQRAALTDKVVRLFEKKHPDITVRTTYSTYDAYVQKLATQAAGRDLPDVAQLDYRQISQYAGSGTLLNLDPYVKDGTLRTADFDPQLTSTGKYAGRQYAFPMGRGITGFAYDKRVFAKAGVRPPKPSWTWQDWAAAGRRISALHLKGPDGQPYTGLTDVGVNEDAFEDWLRGHGKQLYASQHELGFTAKDLAAFWRFCDGLRREGTVSSAENTSQMYGAVQDSPLARGLAATDFQWDATWLGYVPLLGDRAGLAPVPTTGGRAGQYFKPSVLVGVGANSAHPREAAELVDFVLNDPEAGAILGNTRSTPPNRKIAAAVGRKLSGPNKVVYDYGRTMDHYGVSQPPAAPPRGDLVLQVSFTRIYQTVAFGKETPEQAAREYVAEAHRELR